jgi:hypothetical protein
MGVKTPQLSLIPQLSLEEIADLIEPKIENWEEEFGSRIYPIGHSFWTEVGDYSRREIGSRRINLRCDFRGEGDNRRKVYEVWAKERFEPFWSENVGFYSSDSEEWECEGGKRIEKLVDYLNSEVTYDRIMKMIHRDIERTTKRKIWDKENYSYF